MKHSTLLITLIVFCSPLYTQDYEWVANVAGIGDGEGECIQFDRAGNSYTVGCFGGTTDFDPGAGEYFLSSAGDMDIFILKLDPYGNFIWAKGIGGIGKDVGLSLVLNDSNEIYMTGYFADTVDFDPDADSLIFVSAGQWDLFISKLDTAGNFEWTKSIGGYCDEHGNSIAMDRPGNLYITGHYCETVDFDPGAGTHYISDGGQFILKLDPNGEFIWVNEYDESYSNISIAINPYGYLYVSGSFSNTLDFDPGVGVFELTSVGLVDSYVVKMNEDGGFIWAKSFGGEINDDNYAVTTDHSGNVYTTGSFNGEADFDPGPDSYNLFTAGLLDVYVSKLNPNGEFIWARGMGSGSFDEGFSIAIDDTGNVYTTGYFQGLADFDPGPGEFNISASVLNDVFISKLNVDGDFVWAKSVGGSKHSYGNSICFDQSENLYLTGGYAGSGDFDPGDDVFELTAMDLTDIFILRLGDCYISILSDPTDQTVIAGDTAIFTAHASSAATAVQWQEDSGGGFADLIDGGQYTGVTTDTLLIFDVAVTQNNNLYRCVATSLTCTRSTNSALLTVIDETGISEISENDFSLYPNPAGDFIVLQTEHFGIDLTYTVTDALGRNMITNVITNTTTQIDLSSLQPGIYFIRFGGFSKGIVKL